MLRGCSRTPLSVSSIARLSRSAIAKETLEANLRGVLATLSPEEVNEDRLKFSQQLIDEADDDIKTLDLELDVMKIRTSPTTTSTSIRRSAAHRWVVKQARVLKPSGWLVEAAEASARERADRNGAGWQEHRRANQLRVRTAELEAVAKARKGDRCGRHHRATAGSRAGANRTPAPSARSRCHPAGACQSRSSAACRPGGSSEIIEDGKAQVEVFQRLTDQYQAAGADGQRIFVLNMLPELVDKIVSTVNNVDIDRVAVIDNGGGQGSGIPGLVSQLPGAVVSITEQIEAATGVDILGAMRDDTPSEESEPPPPPPPAPPVED